MKKLILLIYALLLSIILNGCVTSGNDDDDDDQVAETDFVLQLLHFADVDGNEQTALDVVDEFSALVDAFKSDTTYGSQSLLVSSGDFIIPGPRFYAAEQTTVRSVTGSNEPGHADIAFLNAMGVAASAVGNHELDAGPGELADSIQSETYEEQTFPGSTFPFLSVNIDFSAEEDFQVGTDGADTSALAGQVAKYAVTTVNGQKIGLVGAVTPALSDITTTGGLVVTPGDGWTNAQLAAEIQKSVDALVASGVNKIIVLSHMQQIAIEKSLAELLTNVDIIVAGGSNTRMGDDNDILFDGDEAFDETYPYVTSGADGNPTLVVNVDGDYKYLGRLVVGFDADGVINLSSLDESLNGAYASTSANVTALNGTANEEVVAIQTAINSVINEQYGNVVGYTDVYLDGRRSQVRTEETNLGNLTADANLWYANLLSDETVHLSIKNGGGIRTEIGSAILPPGEVDYSQAVLSPPAANPTAGTAEGAVTEGHFRATLRFDNGLVRLTATVEELKDIMEHAVAATAFGSTPGQFPQIGGMRVTFDLTETARTESGTGSRIRELVVTRADGSLNDVVVQDGELQGDTSRTFNLVTLNFLANGGDEYPFPDLSAANRHNFYEGTGFGEETDYPDADLTKDPGNNSSFSYTGGEQDALAEYFLTTYPTAENAFNTAETSVTEDTRIVNLNPPSSAYTLVCGHSDSRSAENASSTSSITLEKIGGLELGGEGAAEIVNFDKSTNRLFVINNAGDGDLEVVDMSDPTAPVKLQTIALSSYGGGPNSVAVCDGLVAVAIEAVEKQANGKVVFFDSSDYSEISSVEVGALPDMLTFTPDGTKVIVANEGEPNDDYTSDPEGSISIIDISGGAASATVTNADFNAFDSQKITLQEAGVRIYGNSGAATVSEDLEPEYITASLDSSTAYVSLQENNALAVVDLESGSVSSILPFGYKDYSVEGNGIDASNKDDGINIQNWPVLGMYQPDSIDSIRVDGVTYVVTANEGDSRDYGGYSEEERVADIQLDSTVFTDTTLQEEGNLGRLKITTSLGDADGDGLYEQLYSYGARSFSIWNTSGTLIYDSGDDFAQTLKTSNSDWFNSDYVTDEEDDEGNLLDPFFAFDDRSDDKGAEPEALVVGEVDGNLYAFIGLERVGGIMVYKITDPTSPEFVQYLTTSNYETPATPGDVAPEGATFISADKSPTGDPLLVVGHEVSGTVTVFKITVQ